MNRSRNIGLLFILGVFALVFLPGCNKEHGFENIELGGVQIGHLRLKNKKIPELEKVFFSINQKTGEIYNAIPISFYTKMDSVAISLELFEKAFAEIAKENSNEYKRLRNDGKDSIWLGGTDRVFNLRVSMPGVDEKKEYRLRINQYQYDPQTLLWERLFESGMPETSGDYHTVINFKEQLLYYLSTDRTKLFVADYKDPGKWQQRPLQGFTGVMCQVSEMQGSFFAVNTDGKLFKSNDGIAWENVALDIRIVALLGVLNTAGKSVGVPAMLVNATPEELSAYKKTDPAAKYTFATLEGGAIRRHSVAPSVFPVRSFSSINIKTYNTESIRLVGGMADKPSSAVWYTTNGTDWLLQSANSEVSPSVYKGSLLLHKKTLYYYSYKKDDGGLTVDFSTDFGQTWQKGVDAVMLPKTENYGVRTKNIVAFKTASDHAHIYLMGGYNKTAGKQERDLWQGTLKLDVK